MMRCLHIRVTKIGSNSCLRFTIFSMIIHICSRFALIRSLEDVSQILRYNIISFCHNGVCRGHFYLKKIVAKNKTWFVQTGALLGFGGDRRRPVFGCHGDAPLDLSLERVQAASGYPDIAFHPSISSSLSSCSLSLPWSCFHFLSPTPSAQGLVPGPHPPRLQLPYL